MGRSEGIIKLEDDCDGIIVALVTRRLITEVVVDGDNSTTVIGGSDDVSGLWLRWNVVYLKF